MSDEVERRTSSQFERHLQTGLVLLVVGVLGWVGVSVNETSRYMATMQERVSWMSESIKELKTQLTAAASDRYTQSDARRDFSIVTHRFEQVENRVTAIEANHMPLHEADK